jgi:4-hydroxy-4-methyl-2-oxoglutarate aldolase
MNTTDPRALKALAAASTGMLSDALGRWGAMHSEIRSMAPGARCCGPAFTVRCWPADNLTIHRALELTAPGDILVIDGGNQRDTALIGDVMVYAAQLRGVAGIVLQGLVRDRASIATYGLPLFACGSTPRAAIKDTLGPLQVPIQCGGVVVRPGDVVVGDDDGVVVVPHEETAVVVERLGAMAGREEKLRQGLAAGQTTVDILGLRAKVDK